MKSLFIFIAILLTAINAEAQWKIVSVKSKPLKKQTSAVSEDFWLTFVIKNTSDKTLHIQGFGKWYMIESYIKKDKGAVWERQNTGVDRKLEMIPIKPGEEITTVSRQATKDIGKSIMLTFLTGGRERILLGDVKIPKIP